MKSLIDDLIANTRTNSNEYRPLFYRLANSKDETEFKQLLNENKHLQVHDEIFGQVEELVKSCNPKTVYTKEQLKKDAEKHFGTIPKEKYGVWVFYPWLNKLVHILDEDEFILVRTNRNQYKITPQEKALLSEKKIGVIGLSVGQSIALTIAMERICGEIRIIDFDILELSNLNRIRAGVHDLGIKKTIMAAREISEIDPYLKVTIYSDGLTEENVDDFFTKNGKLDICIEVCDGLYAKIFSRQKAKAYGIPVVMNSSDRGTTDIERYDLNPELPLMHGLIDHLDLTKVKEAKTNEEKVPYLLPMLGVETSTNRLKASMLEIQETITTWPQLASGVILGGGICTDVCRRILLGELKESGRYFVDLEDLIKDGSAYDLKNEARTDFVFSESSIDDYKDIIKEIKNGNYLTNPEDIEISDADFKELVSYAALAPSGGNMQPWKWLYKDRAIWLFDDEKLGSTILNYKKTASQIALGAATQNLKLRAEEKGLRTIVLKHPLGLENPLTALIKFSKLNGVVDAQNKILSSCIQRRITNRNLVKRENLKVNHENELKALAIGQNDFDLKIFTEPSSLEKIKKIISQVDKLFYTSQSGNTHFNNEIRWNIEEAERTKNGVDIRTVPLTATEFAGYTVSKKWDVTKHIQDWGLGNAFGKLSSKGIDSASAVCVLTMKKKDFKKYYDAGMLLQKIWLRSTSLGIGLQPMSISTFLFARCSEGNTKGIEDIVESLTIIRKEFLSTIGLFDDEIPVFIFRLCYADEPKVKSLRKPIDKIILYE